MVIIILQTITELLMIIAIKCCDFSAINSHQASNKPQISSHWWPHEPCMLPHVFTTSNFGAPPMEIHLWVWCIPHGFTVVDLAYLDCSDPTIHLSQFWTWISKRQASFVSRFWIFVTILNQNGSTQQFLTNMTFWLTNLEVNNHRFQGRFFHTTSLAYQRVLDVINL